MKERNGTLKLKTFSMLSKKLDIDPSICWMWNNTLNIWSNVPFLSSSVWKPKIICYPIKIGAIKTVNIIRVVATAKKVFTSCEISNISSIFESQSPETIFVPASFANTKISKKGNIHGSKNQTPKIKANKNATLLDLLFQCKISLQTYGLVICLFLCIDCYLINFLFASISNFWINLCSLFLFLVNTAGLNAVSCFKVCFCSLWVNKILVALSLQYQEQS